MCEQTFCSSSSSTPVPACLSGEYVQYGDTCTTSHVKRMAMVAVVMVGEDEGQKAVEKKVSRDGERAKREKCMFHKTGSLITK